MKKVMYAVFAIFAIAISGQAASAQGTANNTVTVAPSISDISVDPGQSASRKFTVANQGSRAFSFAITRSPYSITSEDYDASFEPLPGRTPVTEWVNVHKPTEGSLDVGRYADIAYDIIVPASAKPGGYSMVVFVETDPQDESKNSIRVKNRIAHIVYITVNGFVEKTGNVEGPNIPLLGFTGKQRLNYFAINSGGSNERVKLKTNIQDVFGRTVSEGSLDRYTLPGTKRSLHYDWQSNPFFGVYKVSSDALYVDHHTESVRWTVLVSPVFIFVLGIVMGVIIWRTVKRSSRIQKKAKA